MIKEVKLLEDILPNEADQWNNDIWVVENELTVKFYKT